MAIRFGFRMQASCDRSCRPTVAAVVCVGRLVSKPVEKRMPVILVLDDDGHVRSTMETVRESFDGVVANGAGHALRQPPRVDELVRGGGPHRRLDANGARGRRLQGAKMEREPE
jgi:hypothetical protein